MTTKIPSKDKIYQDALAYLEEHSSNASVKKVFTNGCFDLLHAGHVDYLEKAAAQGDVFIVGLNSDASVQRLKGPERPIISWSMRARMLAALSCVDAVIKFEEDTPLELIKCIKPDVLIKGGDYKPSEIVGADFVLNLGGKVNTIDFVYTISTSQIIDKLKKS